MPGFVQAHATGGMDRANETIDVAPFLRISDSIDPVSFFFEGLEGQVEDTGEARGDILADKEALELVRAYYSMPELQRKRLFDLARVLSDVA